MLKILPKELKNLAKASPSPLYLVGGSVRDFLAGRIPAARDFDICAPLSGEKFAELAKAQGFTVQAVYKNTGTVKLKGEEENYEFSCFRSDKYVRGKHVPVEIFFTEDMTLDAKRRDFTANAVYFDIAKGEFIDPLEGIPAIREKRLTTVDEAQKVFGEDGLRLMRLCRQAAQLGFEPDEACLAGAKQNADLILDISPERILEELLQILTADKKYGLAHAPYHGLRLLERTGVLDKILPELAQGRGLIQRADFHKYDVLEHSFKAVDYIECDPTLRLAALLHDVGKPLCMRRDGNAHAHTQEGVRLAQEILRRLKVSKKMTETLLWLLEWHMYDYDCKTGEKKLRRFLATHYERLPLLLKIKQADFSACMDDTSPSPTCTRWSELLARMQKEGVPFRLQELAVNGKDILGLDIPPPRVAEILHALFLHAAVSPQDNQRERLLKLAKSFSKN